MTKKKTNILLTAFLFLSLHSISQFHYAALLDTVKTTGFYNIPITPELSSYLKTDLSDLRIIDGKKQPVAFISDIPSARKAILPVLLHQEIIKKETIDSKTILEIANPGKSELSNFIIELKSAAAERIASLSGSDDKVNWFAILDSLLLHKSGEYNNTSHSQRINFPPGNYKYFRLTISNDKKEALNIVNVTSFDISPSIDINQFFFDNPAPSLSQTDSGRYSLVKIINDKPYHISRIKLNISGPWFYKRQAKLFTEMKPGLQETWNSNSHIALTLSSDEFSPYFIPFLKSKVLYLLIENGDNSPLKIDSIATAQVKRRVIAQLEKGSIYSLLLDNPGAIAPDYDLQHFRERIPDNSVINIKNIIALPQPETITSKKQTGKWWIWPAIIFIALLLAILAWKLTADMKNKK
ncbi:MAG: hypothetical protein ABI675_24920 [Chitinophagaceae bacterium]